MSLTLTLSGNSSIINTTYFPTINLNGNYVCALVDFQTYNSIPNIDENNNLFYYGTNIIEIPTGSYEIDDINEFLNKKVQALDSRNYLSIIANNNTLKSEIHSNEIIYFNKPRSLRKLLGFSKQVLQPNKTYESDLPVNVIKVNAIRIECSILSGSFINNVPAHTLHEFSPKVGPGYKIVEVPKNMIYLPVNVKELSCLTIKLIDQDNNLINLRGETITLRIHLKKLDNVNI
jgi:hypothetical protein